MVIDLTISLPFLLMFFTGVLSLLWAMFMIKNKAESAHFEIENLKKENQGLKNDIANFRIDVIQNYASINYLKETENRIVSSVNSLAEEFRSLRQHILDKAKGP